jgi:hypothetical protein
MSGVAPRLAIQLMSEHPGMRLGGPFEIRALDEEISERKVTAA